MTISKLTQPKTENLHLIQGPYPVSVKVSRFQGASGIEEFHMMFCPTKYANAAIQLDWIFRAYQNTINVLSLSENSSVLRRFFCSDLQNQSSLLQEQPFSNPLNTEEPCAVSWINQPPIPPAKIALWAYHIEEPNGELMKTQEARSLTIKRGELCHNWQTGILNTDEESSYDQSRGIFEQYDSNLHKHSMNLSDNVIRTWLYVQNIDSNYQGLVNARREYFAEQNLTPATHFIASTGIEGVSSDVMAKVSMDAYAISGVRQQQIEYLQALDHLGPTHRYGVTFERATSVSFQDRKQIFISGTASINPEGNVVHPGNVSLQLDRALENIEALLIRAAATLTDMNSFIVYVRDVSDYELVQKKMQERFGNVPFIVVLAPVCRPGWLIEVEGMATVSSLNSELPAF